MLSIHSHAERPELENQKWSSRVNLPEFLFHAVGPDDIPARLLRDFPEFQLYCCDGEELVGIAHSIPIKWNGTDDGLPAGWTAALELGLERDATATDLAALRVDIRRDRQRQGYSRVALRALRRLARIHGLAHLIAPVRASLKSRYPLTALERYVKWETEEGEPFDPWIRVHTRDGGHIAHVAPRSVSFRASVGDWEAWTGMRFPETGEYIVEGALAPVSIDCERDLGTHVEPGVWVVHDALPDGEEVS